MKRPKRYKMPHRRRREKKTDYRLRLSLLRSGKPRFIVRKSNNNILCQVIESNEKGDKTIVSVSSRDIKALGWKAHCGNIPSAYIVGYLCAKKSSKKEAVFDIGTNVSTKGSAFYAALKGAVDGGLKIPHSKEILPDEKRARGGHIAAFALKLKKERPDEYKKRFSTYLKAGISPEDLPKHFEEVLRKISK